MKPHTCHGTEGNGPKVDASGYCWHCGKPARRAINTPCKRCGTKAKGPRKAWAACVMNEDAKHEHNATFYLCSKCDFFMNDKFMELMNIPEPDRQRMMARYRRVRHKRW